MSVEKQNQLSYLPTAANVLAEMESNELAADMHVQHQHLIDKGLISPDGQSKPTPKEELKNFFLERKKIIESEGLTKPRQAEKISLPDGSEVRVVSQVIDLMDFNKALENQDKTKPPKLRIAVMNAGLFEATSKTGFGEGRGNTGNTELKLAASSLYAGEDGYIADALVFIKPEGLNDTAYNNCQSACGEASALKLEQIAQDFIKAHSLPPDTEIEFDLTGYSEGSTQIVSTAVKLLERKSGTIRRVFSIGGAGYIGASSVDEAKPFAFVRQALKEARKAAKLEKTDGYKDGQSFDMEISRQRIDQINQKLKQLLVGDKVAAEGEKIKTMDDVVNILKWCWRVLATQAGVDSDGQSVPWKRLKAACSLNPDRAKLAQAGVPTLVFADHSDPFFAPSLIEAEINALRQTIPETSIQFVSSTLGHDGPHGNQTSFSIVMDDLSQVLTSQPESDSTRKLNPKA